MNWIKVGCGTVLAFSWAGLPAGAVTLSNFEGGSADYDNSTPTQATGKFWDTNESAASTITNNGAGNDSLLFGAGFSNRPAVVYDTTPASAAVKDLFLVPVGSTATLTLDYQPGTSNASLAQFGFVDPAATSTDKGVVMEFRNNNPGTQDTTAFNTLTGEAPIPTTQIAGSASNVGDLAAPIVRMTYNFTNNGTSLTVAGQLETLSALEGTVTGSLPGPVQRTINYGTAAGQMDLAPATRGLEIILIGSAGVPGGGNVDRLTYVPEPASFGLLGFGAFCLFRRRERR